MEQVNLSFKVPSETVEKIRTGESIPYLESRNQSGQITSAYPASDIDPSAESRSEKWSQMAQAVASGAKENPLKTATGLFAAGATISAFVYGWHKFESWRQRRAHENRGVRQHVYATQFHPELTAEALEFRLRLYAHHGYTSTETFESQIAKGYDYDYSANNAILANFAARYRR